MSSYGHFIVEAKVDGEWRHITFNSDKTLYKFSHSDDDDISSHKYCMVLQAYDLRQSLRDGEFGHRNEENNFTEFTKDMLSKSKDNYMWFEGWFYLEELYNLIKTKKQSLDDYKKKNILQAIYDSVRSIYATLKGEEFKKPEDEDNPFSEYYECGCEEYDSEISHLTYIANSVDYMVDEICGLCDTMETRVIVIAG